VLGVACLVAFPPFIAGFFLFYGYACGAAGAWLAPYFGRLCHHWQGFAAGTLRLPEHFALSALNQLVVVAIPRRSSFAATSSCGSSASGGRRAGCGGAVGWALVVSSALSRSPRRRRAEPAAARRLLPRARLRWMRGRTGSIAAGTPSTPCATSSPTSCTRATFF